jgi:hypothetical protein
MPNESNYTQVVKPGKKYKGIASKGVNLIKEFMIDSLDFAKGVIHFFLFS